MKRLLGILCLAASPAFADSVPVKWVNPTACTASTSTYTHLGVNVLVNGGLMSFVATPGTSYTATLKSGDVVTATACGYCGAPPANGGTWTSAGRCTTGNESAPSNAVAYTSSGGTAPANNGTTANPVVLSLGSGSPSGGIQESDTFSTIGPAWSTINSIAPMTVSNGNVQCATPNVDCGIIRNTTWPANQASTVTVGTIATGDEVGAFVRATTGRMGYMCNQLQGGTAKIFEMNGTSSWNQLAAIAGVPLAPGGTLTCSVVGSLITLKVNGVTLLQVTNNAHTSGQPGVTIYDPDSISLRVSDWRGDSL
jgi:hypothetical protein